MIEKLDLAGYFLIVWDIVQYCRREKILVQGRGSAANSAVCYALSITAVDPVRMDLLFERFLSEERGEWPDIDLDLPSGDQREKVIQHVYEKYGPRGAGMTANVITYRDRSAARETGKALGFSPDQVDNLSKQLGGWSFGEIREPIEELGKEIAAAGLDPEDVRCEALPAPLPPDPEPAAPPGAALRRDGRRQGEARRGRAAGAGLDAGPRRRAVGQGRLRGHGDRQGGPAGPGDARRDRGGDPDDPHPREGRDRPGAPAAGRPEDLQDVERGGHGRPLPGREPRADGVAAEERPEEVLRHRRPGRDHPAGPDRGRHGAPLLRPPAGEGARRVPAPVPRADPEAHARRPALPGAIASDRDGRGGVHGRGSRGASPRDGVQAFPGEDVVDREAPARGDGGARDRRRKRGSRSSSPSRPSRSTGFRSPTRRPSR